MLINDDMAHISHFFMKAVAKPRKTGDGDVGRHGIKDVCGRLVPMMTVMACNAGDAACTRRCRTFRRLVEGRCDCLSRGGVKKLGTLPVA